MAPILHKEDNLTAVLYAVNDLRMEQTPIPVPKEHQVLLRMDTIGICGSDVHYLVHGRICHFVVEKPMILGHESSGVVVSVGKDVKNLKEGDRVAIEPGEACRLCAFCKEGRYNLCPEMSFCATPPVNGNLTRYYCHAADFCYKLPDNVSLEEGALMEPLSVGVHACKRGDVGVGSVVLVFGAGPIGLMTLLTAKAFSASKVLIADVDEHRLSFAKTIGADCTLKIGKESDLEIVKKIHDALGCEPTVTIDCCGAEQAVRVSLQATKSGGVVVMVGHSNKLELTLPIGSAAIREVDVRGCFRYVNDYKTSLELIATGKVNVNPLITHHYKLEDSKQALERAITGDGNPIKILIHADPNWKP